LRGEDLEVAEPPSSELNYPMPITEGNSFYNISVDFFNLSIKGYGRKDDMKKGGNKVIMAEDTEDLQV
jgi:hypothetical protein